MPRDPFKPLLEKEQRLVYHYLREGAVPEKLHLAARRARVPIEEAKNIIGRPHVVAEINRRKAMVEMEENRLIAKDKVKEIDEAVKRDRLAEEKILSAFDRILDLDPKEHGRLILDTIVAGAVFNGTIEDGTRRRVVPAQTGPDGETRPSIYRAIFTTTTEVQGEVKPVEEAPAPLLPEGPIPPPPKPAVLKHPAKPAPTPQPKAQPAAGKPAAEIVIT